MFLSVRKRKQKHNTTGKKTQYVQDENTKVSAKVFAVTWSPASGTGYDW